MSGVLHIRSWPFGCLSAVEPLLSLTWTDSASIYSYELYKISQPACPISFVAIKKSLLSPTQVYSKVPGKWDTKLNYPYSSLPAYLFPEQGLGEGNGNPLQYSCLENPMDGGAW